MFSKLTSEETTQKNVRRRFFNFIGIGIEGLTYQDMESRIDQWISDKSDRSHHIACLNAYCVSLSFLNNRLRNIYNQADIAGPDGMPFVRWIRWVMNMSCDRFAAPDIALHLAERSKEKGYTFYLYGGAPEVLEQMRKNLEKRFSHIHILGAYSPPFRELTEKEDQLICDEINQLRPDIILIGLGTPKQDYWIDEHIEKLRGSVLIASGATFDFFGGRIKMAPHWIRNSGFEWFYRLFSKDFFRLWKRYTYYNYLFMSRFVLQLSGVCNYRLERSNR